MRVRFIRLLQKNINRHQSKEARSKLPHEASNQYGEGIVERRCCVRGSTCIKTHGIAMHAIGEVLIY